MQTRFRGMAGRGLGKQRSAEAAARALPRLHAAAVVIQAGMRSWLCRASLVAARTFEIAIQTDEVRIGLYPTVTFQYSSTTSYQGSYHIQYLLFESDNRMSP